MTAPVRAEAKPEVREKVRIDFAYQFRTVIPILLFGALFALLTFLLVLLPIGSQASADPNPVLRAVLGAQLFRIELWLVPLLVLSGSVGAIAALLHARRVVRPVKRVQMGLAKLAIGEPAPLVLEPRDEFRELEAPFAGVVSRVENLSKGKLELLRFLRHNLEGLSQRSASGQLSPQELQESLAALMRDVDAEIKKLQMKA